MYIVVYGVVWNPEAYYGHSSWAKWYPSPWVPNLFETMSHCPIDDSEMSQTHCTKYIALYRSQILGPTRFFGFFGGFY